MMFATMCWVSLLCVFGMCAAAQTEAEPVIACNTKAIAAADRPRHRQVAEKLRASIRSRTETAKGFRFTLDSGVIQLRDLAEWIHLERLCCPFFTFQLSVPLRQPNWLLTLTGPSGVKPLLDAEFPQR
jgi:hypothetical protein